ncbi:kinesin-like protein KIF28 [Antedon mediterranea]|uniref:kinesin-like protein KIF28 n=1 Tax=Antedon mediterranea TaxID=105859 RepID=UPI003AF78701
MSGGGESVKVAVRVRPFNSREKERGAKLIISMDGALTKIQNPETPKEDPKSFTFDYSYWSHDNFTEDSEGNLVADPGSNYASQRIVFQDLGRGVLDNAFKGFNCSLFAYGQTGSGKSYSMVGYGPNKGIVPITCDELFKTMAAGKQEVKYQVTFSMLEIYNEQVRDLLEKVNPKGGLTVRQNPKLGLFYVVNLRSVAVGSYAEIEKRIAEGTANRTVASTNMNATSSRAHTVVTIVFDQISKNESGQETKKSSVINLVDLAGSERADSTGATGDRLKEGANINKSLSALGNVISALADLSMGKKKIMVPYRDSVLTKLLQNALGGNSKTVMIAALSPADINYDETLGTLRYADRAKKIKNKAVVNENPMDKLIRELREENDKLKKSLTGGMMPENVGMSQEDIDKMKKEMEEEIRAQLLANQKAISDMDWDQKLEQQRAEDVSENNERDLTASRKKKEPHLLNLNEDPQLSGVVCHFLGSSETTFGRKDADPQPTITLNGLSIQKKHAIVSNSDGEVEIKPGSPGAKIKVNGIPLVNSKVLENLDRILFGSNHMYVYHNPAKADVPEGTPATIDWEFAQKEIAHAKGYQTAGSGLSKEQQRVQDQILELLPMVNEVNAVSEELNKHRSFEIVLISGAAQEGKDKETEVMVKMKNLLNENTWVWGRGKFINRRYLIQELYQRFIDGEDVSDVKDNDDPFWEPPEDVLIGTAHAFLQSLGYSLDFDDNITVTDFKGTDEGKLYITIKPCTQDGKPYTDEEYVDDPSELLGKPYHIKIGVINGDVHKARYSKGLMVKYRFYEETEYTETPMLTGTLSPEWNHSRIVSIPVVTQEVLDYFETGSITYSLYGHQENTAVDTKRKNLTTKELRQLENMQEASAKPILNKKMSVSFGPNGEDETTHLKSELVLLQKQYDRLRKKERRMQDICEEWEKKPVEDQQFLPFYRKVHAVAFSSGSRLKSRIQIVNKVLQGQRLVKSLKNGGGKNIVKGAQESSAAAAANGNGNAAAASGNGNAAAGAGGGDTPKGKAEGSKACLVM